MKTAYELAMERLSKAAPATKLTSAQKKQLAEVDSTYAAKIAGREIALKDEIGKLAAAAHFAKVDTPERTKSKSWPPRVIPKKSRRSNSNGSTSEKNFRPGWKRKRNRCVRANGSRKFYLADLGSQPVAYRFNPKFSSSFSPALGIQQGWPLSVGISSGN